MKKYVTYEEIKEDLNLLYEQIQNKRFQSITAVVRGGLTLAHLISKDLRLPVNVLYPSTKTHGLFVSGRDVRGKTLIVEDLVAEGRTLEDINRHCTVDYEIYTYLIDKNYAGPFPNYWSKVTDEWIVFPWENVKDVTEGDRGLFREGTDVYGF